MNIVICEDDRVYCKYIQNVINEYIEHNLLDFEIVLATDSVEDIIEYIRDNSELTIYYLDIRLNAQMDGIDIASMIRDNDDLSNIIFITNYAQERPNTYNSKVEALDFIVKGEVDNAADKICDALDYAASNLAQKSGKCLCIDNRVCHYIINLEDIIYIESVKNDHKVTIHCENMFITARSRIRDIEKQLDRNFMRCHKSYIINKNKVVDIDREARVVILEAGNECEYSPMWRGRKSLKKLKIS